MALEIVLEPQARREHRLVLAAVVCGESYYQDWRTHSLPNWARYAAQHGYGLALLRDTRLPERVSVGWNKFFLPSLIRDHFGNDAATLVLDADQVFSPIAPAIHDHLEHPGYGLVHIQDWSDRRVHPRRLLSYLRRIGIDPEFPFDSVLVMSEQDWRSREFLDLRGHLPISSGFILVPADRAVEIARITRYVLDPDAGWDGGGGDQSFASRELQQQDHYFLDRRWQGIWPSIMAVRHPFFFFNLPIRMEEAQGALASALMSHWCIHFSTSWPEKQFWKVDWMEYWDERISAKDSNELAEYLHSDLTVQEYGRIVAPEVAMIQPRNPSESRR